MKIKQLQNWPSCSLGASPVSTCSRVCSCAMMRSTASLCRPASPHAGILDKHSNTEPGDTEVTANMLLIDEAFGPAIKLMASGESPVSAVKCLYEHLQQLVWPTEAVVCLCPLLEHMCDAKHVRCPSRSRYSRSCLPTASEAAHSSSCSKHLLL